MRRDMLQLHRLVGRGSLEVGTEMVWVAALHLQDRVMGLWEDIVVEMFSS